MHCALRGNDNKSIKSLCVVEFSNYNNNTNNKEKKNKRIKLIIQ